MTLAELLADDDRRRFEFPVADRSVFLAHAGVCPLPRRVSDAIRNYAQLCGQADQETLLPGSQIQKTRELAARILHAHPDEVAFVGPTSLALSFVAGGLSFRHGDNVVVYLDDYPSNVYPWMALGQKGVTVRFVKPEEFGLLRPADILSQIDGQTRLVALASCHFIAGYRIDLSGIGELLRQRGILFCVDAIQTLGAFPTPVDQIDFLAADAHKWLLGPCAAGILYVRQSVRGRLEPIVHGWNNIRCPQYVAQPEVVFRSDARRYEAGTYNWLGLVGLHAALELLLEIGVDEIAAELLRKRAWLVPALQARGCSVLHASAGPESASGIITFFRPGTDLAALHQTLEKANIITSLRTDRAGQQYIRLSPHFYNTDAELNRLLEFL